MDEFAKVAALLSHLDAKSRDQILNRLPSALRDELARRSEQPALSQHELTRLVMDYQSALRELVEPNQSESTPKTLIAASSEETETLLEISTGLELDPEVTLARLVEVIAGERATSLAGIISQLPESFAVEVFALLSAETRRQTLALLPKVAPISPLVLDEIQQHLHDACRPTKPRNPGGFPLLARLLRTQEPGLLESVKHQLTAEEQTVLREMTAGR